MKYILQYNCTCRVICIRNCHNIISNIHSCRYILLSICVSVIYLCCGNSSITEEMYFYIFRFLNMSVSKNHECHYLYNSKILSIYHYHHHDVISISIGYLTFTCNAYLYFREVNIVFLSYCTSYTVFYYINVCKIFCSYMGFVPVIKYLILRIRL